MSVELFPPELAFRRPFTTEVSQVLRLRNAERDPVAFKVKTTAPKQYCVRPNSGRIEAGGEVEVQVLLQAMKEDPPPDAKCRDKFLVQAVAITADREFSKVADIWQHVDQTAKGSVQEKKIRVLFLPADGSNVTPSHNRVNGTSHDLSPDAPPAYTSRTNNTDDTGRSPSPEAVTPARGPVSRPESRPADNKHLGDAVASASNPATDGQQQSVIGSVASAVPTNMNELKAQLADAQATISQMTAQAKDQGLRQRKTDAVTQDARERITSGATGMGVRQQPGEGVPVQIVAGLCLLSFLLAYMFF
ncbi:MAG: phosphatidylinositol-binding protein scs2 [Piccolia ochrophora]|nr:MAG: phosphatidylinositol-binding protein scs2 [Piccolia ochrophora]